MMMQFTVNQWISVIVLVLDAAGATSSDVIACNLSSIVRISSYLQEFSINSPSLSVHLNIDELKIDNYNDSRIVNIFAEKVEVHFSGYENHTKVNFSAVYTQDMRAYAERQLKVLGTYVPVRWRVLLLPFDNHPEMKDTVFKNDVRRLAEQCLEKILPEKVTINEENFRDFPSVNDTCMLPMPYKYSITDSTLQAVQPLFNKFLDVMLEEGKRRFLDDIGGVVPLQYMHLTDIVNEKVFIRLSIFFVHSGKARDLRNLYRAGDASITKMGDKYTFTCGFIIIEPYVTYQHITGIGGARFYGDLMIHIKDVYFTLTASFDESVKPCLLTVDKINVTRIGDVDIDVNGFSPLNGIAADAAQAAVDGVKMTVGDIIAEEIKTLGQQLVDTVDCERLGVARV